MSDWIKVHRSVVESYAFANPVSLKIWLWMLLKANYKKTFIPLKIGKGIVSVEVDRGQFLFGRFKAEEELNIDGSMIYRQLQKFEELEQIKIESNNQYSIITICNYDVYQSKLDKNEQQVNIQRTAGEQQKERQRTADEHSIEELERIEPKEGIEVAPPNKLWFLQYYYSPYEIYQNAFNGQSTTEDLFNQWKELIGFIYESKYETLFECKFLSPHSFATLVEKSSFTKDKWDATLKKILATGVKPEHDLFFRIPEFMGYIKPEGKFKKRELSEYEQNLENERLMRKNKK